MRVIIEAQWIMTVDASGETGYSPPSFSITTAEGDNGMTTIYPLLLILGSVLPASDPPPATALDPSRLREMLLHRQHPLKQNQAAILLVQSCTQDAEQIIREGV